MFVHLDKNISNAILNDSVAYFFGFEFIEVLWTPSFLEVNANLWNECNLILNSNTYESACQVSWRSLLWFHFRILGQFWVSFSELRSLIMSWFYVHLEVDNGFIFEPAQWKLKILPRIWMQLLFESECKSSNIGLWLNAHKSWYFQKFRHLKSWLAQKSEYPKSSFTHKSRLLTLICLEI